MLTLVLAVAAFMAGLTGAWSPCGFSMVSTLGEHARGRAATAAAVAAFVPGALLGGVLTFGCLAAVGALLGGGGAALLVAAGVAGLAALAEASGLRIVPQVRRQVPEHWRRVLPLPLAAAGYGVLLGLGFTTFVLTFAVPALAGVSLAIGDLATGAAVGLAFGAGRALPVAVLAPLARASLGQRATELMAERPAILRGLRAADALALGACAVALLAVAPAGAATRAWVDRAADPTATPDALAWKVPGGPAILRSGGADTPFAADAVAIGGRHVAARVAEEVRVADRASGAPVVALLVPGARDVAVSDTWVAVRRTSSSGDRIDAWHLPDAARASVAAVPAPAQLGRPALDGDRLVFHVAGRRASRIVESTPPGAPRVTLRRSSRRQLVNPSTAAGRLLYVETTPYAQSLVVGPLHGRRGRRTLLRIAPAIRADRGYSTSFGPHRRVRRPRRPPEEGSPGTTTTLWTTALAPDAAFVTRLRARGGRVRAALLRVAL